MISRNAILIPLGVICGFILTLTFRYLFVSTNPVHSSFVDDPLRTSNVSSVQELLEERKQLMLRIRNIDHQLNVSSTSHIEKRRNEIVKAVSSPIVTESEKSIQKTEMRPMVDSQACKYDFKVFVYPLPTSLLSIRISEEARYNRTLHVCQKCIFEQFSLEYIMYDFFSQFCGRTHNPQDADFFYLPIVRDAEYRMALESRGPRARSPSLTEQALLNIMEKNSSEMWRSVFQYTDSYWHRKQGADHIIVMPAPVTNLRHESSQRGYFHYMSHLHRPIFLGVEYSIQFVQDYPICATKKNMVVPYPTTDPDLFNGRLLNFNTERKSLLYYAGGMHGDCIETRRAMMILMRNSSRLNNVIPKVRNGMAEREHGFLSATFCPIPIGDSPSSKRMYDVLNFGCIPVVLSDDLVWAFTDQTGGLMNHADFAIQLPQSVVQYTSSRSIRVYENRKDEFGILPVSKLRLYDLLVKAHSSGVEYENGHYINPLVQILRQVPAEDIEHLKRNGVVAAKNYRYYAMNVSMDTIPTAQHRLPDGGAVDQISLSLSRIKSYGVDKLSVDCQHERLDLKHTYRGRYTCDTDKTDSLITNKRNGR